MSATAAASSSSFSGRSILDVCVDGHWNVPIDSESILSVSLTAIAYSYSMLKKRIYVERFELLRRPLKTLQKLLLLFTRLRENEKEMVTQSKMTTIFEDLRESQREALQKTLTLAMKPKSTLEEYTNQDMWNNYVRNRKEEDRKRYSLYRLRCQLRGIEPVEVCETYLQYVHAWFSNFWTLWHLIAAYPDVNIASKYSYMILADLLVLMPQCSVCVTHAQENWHEFVDLADMHRDDPSLSIFLIHDLVNKKLNKRNVPDESTFRRTHLPKYQQVWIELEIDGRKERRREEETAAAERNENSIVAFV